MGIRLILAAVVVVGATLCGKALSDAARLRAKTLRELTEDVRLLRVHMVSMFEPVPDSMARANSSILQKVSEGMKTGLSAAAAWEKLRMKAHVLSREDREALDGLFEQLGESGRESQDALLTGTAEKLARLAEAAEERARAAERLYGTLGLLVGLALALIVI